jgi:hypothetical protein
MSENVGASTSRNPKGLHGLYRDIFAFIGYSNSWDVKLFIWLTVHCIFFYVLLREVTEDLKLKYFRCYKFPRVVIGVWARV